MTADVIFIVLLAALVCLAAVWIVIRALRVASQLRGVRIVTCPETGRPAAVAFDVRRAIVSDAGEVAPRLRACSRWAERGRCDEACVREALAASAPKALVERALTGKACAFCRKRIEHVAFLGHYPALLQADGTTIAWPDLPLERLQEGLGAQRPVCWDCHIAETFRRRYPELVTDRPWTRA